jgi:hypothetical protein
MAAESNTPVDIEIWIEKVINSCETVRHRINANNLVRLYLKRIAEEGMPYYQYIHIRDKFEDLLWKVEEVKEVVEEELWDHYSGLPNPLWYERRKQLNDE